MKMFSMEISHKQKHMVKTVCYFLHAGGPSLFGPCTQWNYHLPRKTICC